jgi:hypothetical protein
MTQKNDANPSPSTSTWAEIPPNRVGIIFQISLLALDRDSDAPRKFLKSVPHPQLYTTEL